LVNSAQLRRSTRLAIFYSPKMHFKSDEDHREIRICLLAMMKTPKRVLGLP